MPLGHKSIRQLSFGISVVVLWHFDSCFWPRQLFYDKSAVVFCCLGSCFLITWQFFFLPARHLFLPFWLLFFVGSTVVFYSPTHTVDQISTVQLFGSYVLLFWQLCFDASVVFWYLGSCVSLVRQLFFDRSAIVSWFFGSCVLLVLQFFFPWQLFFAGSAVVFWKFGSCFLFVWQFCATWRTQ